MEKYGGYDKPKNRRVHYGNKIFKEKLRQYGKDITIDRTPCIGIIENNQNPYSDNKEDRVLQVGLNTELNRGSYIGYDNSFYLVITGIDKYDVSKDCKIRKCNQMLKWVTNDGRVIEYPCIISNDAYGSKMNTNNDHLSDIDTKAKIEVQYNSDTREIGRNHRFLFNNSKYDIFKSLDVNTSIKEGILTIITKKDTYRQEDDLENNIAYNKIENHNEEDVLYGIIGDDFIKVDTVKEYVINPHKSVEWEVDSEVAEICSCGDNSCEVLAKVRDEVFVLSAWSDNKKISETTISIDR